MGTPNVVYSSGRKDIWWTDDDGDLIQKWTTGSGWNGGNQASAACRPNAEPQAAWEGSEMHVYAEGASSGTVFHWWYDGSVHTEVL